MMLMEIREKILIIIGKIRYFYNKKLRPDSQKLQVMSIDETLQTIKEKKCSIIRFGDGEISAIRNRNLHFQQVDEELRQGLVEALTAQDENLLICIPDVFDDLSHYTKDAENFQIRTLAIARSSWYKYCNKHTKYGNAFCSRWTWLKDQSNTEKWYEDWFSIWQNEEVVIVEGEFSRNGVGNNMFAKTKSVERILAPNLQAWNKYQEILEEILKVEKNKLILLALGPTAKILAYNLFKRGYRVLDIGHLDIGYETCLHGIKKGENIKGKYFLETRNNQDLDWVDSREYQKYQSEIRTIIKGESIEK